MDFRLLLQGLCGTLGPRKRTVKDQRRLSSIILHAPKRPACPLGMIEGLASRYRVEECSFNTIFGSFQGHKIYASRKVAENIEKQTRYTAELYSVDIRQDQDIWLRKTSSPESSFSPDLSPLDKVEILVLDPQNIRVEFSQDRSISDISYLRGTTSNLSTRLSSMSTTSNRRLPHSK